MRDLASLRQKRFLKTYGLLNSILRLHSRVQTFVHLLGNCEIRVDCLPKLIKLAISHVVR